MFARFVNSLTFVLSRGSWASELGDDDDIDDCRLQYDFAWSLIACAKGFFLYQKLLKQQCRARTHTNTQTHTHTHTHTFLRAYFSSYALQAAE